MIHNIVHFELAATDRKALSKFYSDVFGWTIEHEEGMNYTTFETGEGVGGGFNPVTEDNPVGSVIFYIHTDNVTGALKAVEKAGGKTLVPETEIPNYGKFGIFLDPQGNKTGLFQPLPMA